MIGLLKSFFYDFRNTFTVDDRMITILATSLLLPWPVGIVGTVIVGIHATRHGNFKIIMQRFKAGRVLFVLPFFCLIVALFTQNWPGVFISMGMEMVFLAILYYRFYINKHLFEIIVDMMIILSIFSVVFAIFEQLYYFLNVDAMHSYFDIQNKPAYRVKAFFMNANYYDVMIMYIEAMCVYRFMEVKKTHKRILYVLAGLANIFALYLTGGRMAWLCIAAGVLVMILANRWYKTFATFTVLIGGGIGALLLKPNLIPRLATHGLAVGRRSEIWRTARLIIHDHWLCGQGPLGYYTVWSRYLNEYKAVYGTKMLEKYKTLGISAPHSHSLLYEPLISFGAIGVIMLLVYLFDALCRHIRLFSKHLDRGMGALILGVSVMTIIFCLTDFPMLFASTGGLYLLLIGSADCYGKGVEE